MNHAQRNICVLSSIARAFRHWPLTLRHAACHFSPVENAYRYTITAGRRNSGSRGGKLRNHRVWIAYNLTAMDRMSLRALPQEDCPYFD